MKMIWNQPDTENKKRSIDILNLPFKKRMRACAYWMLEKECYNDLQPLSMPVSSENEEGSVGYIAETEEVRRTNSVRVKQILKLRQYLDKTDTTAHQLYLRKIKQFTDEIKKYDSLPTWVEDAIKQFKGKLTAK